MDPLIAVTGFSRVFASTRLSERSEPGSEEREPSIPQPLVRDTLTLNQRSLDSENRTSVRNNGNSGVSLQSVSVQTERVVQTRANPEANASVHNLRALASDLEEILPQESLQRVAGNFDRLFGNLTNPNTGSPVHFSDLLNEESSAFAVTDSDSLEIESYLRMIRMLSDDDESLDRFISQLETFMNGGGGEGSTVDTTFTAALQRQFGAVSNGESVQVSVEEQATFTHEVQIALPERSGEPQRAVTIRYNGEKIVSAEVRQIQQSDPLVFDLDGNGIDLTSAEEGVDFAIDAQDVLRRTAFVAGNDAFLALDRNGNGRIDDGGELFGDQHGAVDGFEELRKFDENSDGVIDENDAVFDRLLLFNDSNRDGISQKGELQRLSEQNISAILLNALQKSETTAGGNHLLSTSHFIRRDGSAGTVGDVLLNFLA